MKVAMFGEQSGRRGRKECMELFKFVGNNKYDKGNTLSAENKLEFSKNNHIILYIVVQNYHLF